MALPIPGELMTLDAKARATETRSGHAEQQVAAIAHMTEKYKKERASLAEREA